MTQKLFIDINVLQTVPPSNINRDDTGSPKQAQYGGVTRSRVSSQAWKRATRKHFWEGTGSADQSTRTKRIQGILSGRLSDRLGLEAEAASRVANVVLRDLKITADKKAPKKDAPASEPETGYLLFFGLPQIEALVDDVAAVDADLAALSDAELVAALEGVSAQDRLSSGHPIDVALFGRMVADLTSLNVDAAAQVAHALSTHQVSTEFDYFTAIDDEKARSADEDAGAGMIGTVEFNSSTLYRYATVGFDQLVSNLDGSVTDAAGAVARFVDSFARSMPTGKSNTFANRTLPSAVIVVIRGDQPVNLVNAFENPVRPGAGLVEASAARLAAQFAEVQAQWASEPVAVLANYGGSLAGALEATFGPSRAFPDLVEQVASVVAEGSMAGQEA